MGSIRTILFDLDGTLADTAPDLAHTLNLLLQEEGRATLPYDIIRPEVSHGSPALVKLGFGLTREDTDYIRIRDRLLEIYVDNLCRETRLFPGMRELLSALHERGLHWGIVTNKPAFLTEPLVERLGLTKRAACVVSGDTTNNRKPHPEPMHHACELTGSRPDECVYVGDAERDIRAGKDAGMRALVALFGYIGENETPDTWGADGMVKSPMEILDWLKNIVEEYTTDD
jgi:N-acetyl-D-muramate 6-phosphate phosphatase